MRTDIRQAEPHDFSRLAEIELFNYRLNFYPIFKDDGYYFGEMNAADMIKAYENTPALTAQTFVYDESQFGCVLFPRRRRGNNTKEQPFCIISNTHQNWEYDDGVVKGFVRVDSGEIVKLFVEPVLQGQNIGEKLLLFAVEELSADHLFALEKNVRAIKFYQRHSFN